MHVRGLPHVQEKAAPWCRGGQEIRVTARGCDHRQGRQMPNFETRGLLLSGSLAPLLDPAPSIRRRLVGA